MSKKAPGCVQELCAIVVFEDHICSSVSRGRLAFSSVSRIILLVRPDQKIVCSLRLAYSFSQASKE